MKTNSIRPNPWSHTHIFATFFFSGRLPIFPGTWGSIAAMPVAYLILTLFGYTGLQIAATIAAVYGTYCAHKLGEELGEPDAGMIVIDEVLAMWIILCFVPYSGDNWIAWWFLTLVTFRFFDIFKPWPINIVDKHMKSGIGVMLDDVVAAAYPLIIIFLLQHLLS